MRMLIAVFLLIGTFLQGKCEDVSTENDGAAEASAEERDCRVSLPHKSTEHCKEVRKRNLAVQRGIFQLAIRAGLGMPLVNMTIRQLIGYLMSDPFTSEETGGYINMLKANKAASQQWLDQHPGEITEYEEYDDIFHTYRSLLADKGNEFYRFVSNKEPFQNILKDWKDDRMFTEQRLSGANPMVLRRVTDDTATVGLKWSELRQTLNPNFDWETAVQTATGSSQSLEEAIKDGHVYVLRYEVFDDMITTPDIMDEQPGRTMWQTKSPVALFAVRPADANKNREAQLQPAAIQIDYKPDSPVFAPSDGGSWTLAKMVVQATDYAHSQMIEHLLKIHLFVEPFCVVLQRHLSSQHPLNQLLKYHCRGVMATNTIGSPSLITQGEYMDKLTAMGYKGTILLVERGYKTLSWRDTDFYLDIKNRGVDDKASLPYFPYRDDSEMLLITIRRMVQDYVYHYYRRNGDVRRDSELQTFVNELSENGTGPDGGRGQIKDFPATLKTRGEVADMVTRLIWVLSVKHAAINYPVGDYGAFTPATPTKIYNDSRVPPGTFSIFNLPNVNISTAQTEVAMNVGTYHYDSLFDYYKELPDRSAARIVKFYYHYLKHAITPMLKYRNRWRFRRGYLTYPYLQHSWIPNGIQT